MVLLSEEELDRVRKDFETLSAAFKIRRDPQRMGDLSIEDANVLEGAERIEGHPDRLKRVREFARQEIKRRKQRARDQALKNLARIREQRGKVQADLPSPAIPPEQGTPPEPINSPEPDTPPKETIPTLELTEGKAIPGSDLKEEPHMAEPGPSEETGSEGDLKQGPEAEPEPKPTKIKRRSDIAGAIETKNMAPAIAPAIETKISKAPAFQLYASDFYMDTSGWTCTQVGAYFRLLMAEWVNNSLPNDTERLARIAQIGHGSFKKMWCPILGGKFTPTGEGNLINRRLEEVRRTQEEYRKLQRESGLRGIEAKKKMGIFPFTKSSDPSSHPLAKFKRPSKRNSSSSSSSSLNNKKPFVEGSEPLRLTSLLLEEIQKNRQSLGVSPIKPPNLQNWARHIDLLIRVDSKTVGQIEKVIKYSQGSFLGKGGNILSTEKLRKHFETLEQQMTSEKKEKTPERPKEKPNILTEED